MSKKLLFIINPRAGKTKSSTPLLAAADCFTRSGYQLQLYLTEGTGHASELVRQYGGDADVVVCAGGDGTLNETIAGLMTLHQPPALGYIPCGSTNDFAASLAIPSDPAQAAQRIAQGTPRALDLGTHNGRYFAYVASFGAFTRSSYSAPQASKNALGHFAYILEGMKGVVDESGTAGKYFDSKDEFSYRDRVCAKTGTAEVTTIDLENNAWFVCFAPYDDPQIAITVMIPFGEGSGTPAPAVAKAIIKEYLGLDYTPTNTNLQTVLAP